MAQQLEKINGVTRTFFFFFLLQSPGFTPEMKGPQQSYTKEHTQNSSVHTHKSQNMQRDSTRSQRRKKAQRGNEIPPIQQTSKEK